MLGGMGRPATIVTLTDEDRATLESWVRATTTEQRLTLRARIVWALFNHNDFVTLR